MQKTINNKAWFLVLPVVIAVAFSAIIPLMTVVNYSIQDVLGPNQRVFVGGEWFRSILRDPELHSALIRQLIYSFCVLALEIPLGIIVALALPASTVNQAESLIAVHGQMAAVVRATVPGPPADPIVCAGDPSEYEHGYETATSAPALLDDTVVSVTGGTASLKVCD